MPEGSPEFQSFPSPGYLMWADGWNSFLMAFLLLATCALGFGSIIIAWQRRGSRERPMVCRSLVWMIFFSFFVGQFLGSWGQLQTFYELSASDAGASASQVGAGVAAALTKTVLGTLLAVVALAFYGISVILLDVARASQGQHGIPLGRPRADVGANIPSPQSSAKTESPPAPKAGNNPGDVTKPETEAPVPDSPATGK